VLGTRRLHALGSFLFGSVGQAVTSASSCPVVVVRGGGTGNAAIGRVIVGIGFDHDSEVVMEFAFDEANLRHVPLEAVTCWRPRWMRSTSLVDRLVLSGVRRRGMAVTVAARPVAEVPRCRSDREGCRRATDTGPLGARDRRSPARRR